VGLDAALIALSGRVRLREGVTRTSEEIITELWGEVFGRRTEGGGQGKAGAPTGATSSPS
jgi:MoxR-like ATPase